MSAQRSITSFFGRDTKRKQQTPANESVAAKNKKYDEKRKRSFLEIWKEQFPWVTYDDDKNVMQCSVCVKYPTIVARNRKNTFVAGCSSFRIEYLKSHDVSDVHLECLSYERSTNRATASTSSSNTSTATEPSDKEATGPLLKALKNLDVQTMKKLEKLFTAAFHVAYRGKPLIDFEHNLELLECVGVNIGTKYRNIPAAKDFIKAIASSIRDEFVSELKKVNFVTILSDGSTDNAVIEQETVFIRFVSHGRPVSFHVATVQLEHCHAEGILAGITSAVNSLGLSFDDILHADVSGPNLVSVNFDGASVMLGCKSGVAAKICDTAKYVVPVHCVAHKLELAVLDAVKKLTTLSDFEDVLKQVFLFYHYSPKMRRELSKIAEIFDTDLVNLSDIKQVRWLASKVRAVRALHTSFHSILKHIESVASGGKSEQSAKCQGWLKRLKTVHFIKTMYVMLDILPLLTEVSLIFQKEDLLIIDVTAELEGLIMKLLNCKLDPLSVGENMTYFVEKYDPENALFDGIKLNGVCYPVVLKEDAFLCNLVDGIISYLDKRFDCFNKSPLKCFSVFDFTNWPTEREALSVFGKAEVSQLLESFSPVFTEDDHKHVIKEFTDLKAYLKGCPRPVYETYTRLLCDLEMGFGKFSHVCKLIELMFVMSPATAICERLFSSMNLVKTRHRTVLNQQTMDDLLTIMTHGPSKLSDFSPRSAIQKWLATGNRHILPLLKENEILTSLSLC